VKRFLAAVSALIVVALVSTGCNASSIPAAAAHVDSLTVTTSELDSSLTGLKSDVGYFCQSELSVPRTTGVGANTWSAAFADDVLTQLIKFRIVGQMVASHHLLLPAADRSLAKLQVSDDVASDLAALQQQTPAISCPGTAASIVAGLGTAFSAQLVNNRLDEDAYAAYLAGTSLRPAALANWELGHRSVATESCTSLIGVSSRATAVKAEKAIIAGGSFATEAKKYSELTGLGAGGSVGCVISAYWPTGLASVVAGLRLRAVSHPVKYETGWLLFQVSKRQLESTGAAVTQLGELESTSFDTEYAKALAAAHISVSPVYGALQRKAVQGGISLAVIPPSTTACAYAVSAAAAGCPATTTSTTVAKGSVPTGSGTSGSG
jgi:parvulin-like peptidyl-prolyl isomerase